MEVNSGELAVGKLGDVALISLDPKDVCEAASTCSDTFAEDIFRRFNGRGISTLIVDGNVIMENGEVETLNEDKIARHIRQLSEMFKEFLMEYQRIKDDVKIGA
jgi:cytosine/adenosine deaminase-related metal-dependent hydrolase